MNKKLADFMKSHNDGVFMIGHASALVRLSNKLILMDPVWNHTPYGQYWIFHPEQIDCESILDKIDACIVSHQHSDHFVPRILEKLKCPVFIMANRPKFRDMMKKHAKSVFSLAPYKWTTIFDDVQIYFVPHAFNTIDSSAAIRNRSMCIYHGNDNFLSEEICERINPHLGVVNIALLPYAFIHYYPHLLGSLSNDERQKETARLNKQSLDQAQNFVKIINPSIYVPFGASLFYADGPENILNSTLSKPKDFAGSQQMNPGDFILDNKANMLLSFYSSPGKPKWSPMPYKEEKMEKAPEAKLGDIRARLLRTRKRIWDHRLIINNITIDLDHLTVSTTKSAKHFSGNITRFVFESDVFLLWLDGLISFEEALGTRRFVYYRTPNVYSLEVIEFYNKYL